MSPINVVWSEGVLGGDGRSRYATNTLLNTAIDRAEVGFVHRNGWAELPSDASGAVVVIQGEHLAGQEADLLNRMASFSWALTVVMGDECRRFNSRPFVGPRRKVWRQYPIPGKHDYEDRRLTAGYPQDCPMYLEHLQDVLANKTLDFSYAGQVNSATRQACVSQLRSLPNGYVYQSSGFWQGLPRDEYYRKVAESKVIACPGGAAFPESLRMGEALEAGCVPVVEDCFIVGTSYWKYVLGEELPFPTLTNWQDFPRLLEQVLREWPANRNRLQTWWAGYKARMPRWFEEDLRAVGALDA
jgi:hypothetical protein